MDLPVFVTDVVNKREMKANNNNTALKKVSSWNNLNFAEATGINEQKIITDNLKSILPIPIEMEKM